MAKRIKRFGSKLQHTTMTIALFFCEERPTISLETKWGLIKHDVAQFCGNYQPIITLNESATFSEDTLQKAFELFKSKHPKENAFVFIHCWLILKDVPRW
jgi:hypothetical protein